MPPAKKVDAMAKARFLTEATKVPPLSTLADN
jgi:hypothetical protein